MTTALVRHYKQHSSGILQSINNLQQIRPVLDYIEQHYAEPIYLDGLCSLVNISRYHFSRYFKKVTGMSISRFITLIRINMAKKMLVAQEMSITEIAEKSGFCNLHYFGKVFKDFTGMSPVQFRNEVAHQSLEQHSGS